MTHQIRVELGESRERNLSSELADFRRVALQDWVILERGKSLILWMTHLHLSFACSTSPANEAAEEHHLPPPSSISAPLFPPSTNRTPPSGISDDQRKELCESSSSKTDCSHSALSIFLHGRTTDILCRASTHACSRLRIPTAIGWGAQMFNMNPQTIT